MPTVCTSPPTRPSSPAPPGWQHRGPGTGEDQGIVHSRDTGGCEVAPPAGALPCSTLGPSAVHAGSGDLIGACAGCCSTGFGCQPLLCCSCSSRTRNVLHNTCMKCGQFRTVMIWDLRASRGRQQKHSLPFVYTCDFVRVSVLPATIVLFHLLVNESCD